MNEKERLLELLKSNALQIGTFRLSSGRTSDYYMDCNRVTLSAEGAYLTAKLMMDMILPEVSAVGGLTIGADPILSSLALLSHVHDRNIAALIIRKDLKNHGTMKFVEGPILEKGAKVAVVEDVVASGDSLLRAVECIAAAGYEPVQTLTLFDRQEGGREAIEKRGYILQALFSCKDLNITKSN